ncbi:phosphoesterase, MJ0936 family [Marinitoga piezophila KA3]|uniref:Phosphoesterase n=1 Tax=Marinitoga piezophila (strain DSM 14283 / JCM 11233 / KA3) TaxID=443254 RepID=H2J3Q5_MARPK|nr:MULTISPECIES: metallophosphoesterase [Marinitoga]AEX85797.1 phosphoesterase, MJ0936 family [Marinitoga piezophila KA3]APT76238.1 hypothetical protein LN42_07460 [Marinitoga sp. 1137]NUU97909.1 hypothetical protein [Marinitoga sp. 1138]
MKKILLISDIHIPTRSTYLQLEKIDYSKYDYIIASGDFIEEEVIFYFKAQSPEFIGVYGNADYYDVKYSLPEKRIINIEGKKIGIIHGHQAGWGDPERLIKRFSNIDIMIYGHTHRPDDRIINNIRCINPGAFCENSYAILEIGSDEVSLKFQKI